MVTLGVKDEVTNEISENDLLLVSDEKVLVYFMMVDFLFFCFPFSFMCSFGGFSDKI